MPFTAIDRRRGVVGLLFLLLDLKTADLVSKPFRPPSGRLDCACAIIEQAFGSLGLTVCGRMGQLEQQLLSSIMCLVWFCFVKWACLGDVTIEVLV